ncbi:MAG: LysR family transcriptional regulator [Acidimicrobiales bacterium]
MDLRQLDALLAVADHGSFTAAARALYTVQSNVSAHVRRLEKELGTVLVDRQHGELTPQGALVADRARRIRREVQAIADDVASFGADVAGQVHAGVVSTAARWLLPQVLAALHEQHPKVLPTVLEASTTSLRPLLVSGRLDLAVVNLPLDDDEIVVEPLLEEQLMVLVLRGHPLSGRASVSVRELAPFQLLLPPSGTALRDDIEGEASRHGVTLSPFAEIDGGRLMTSLALEGIAPAIVPSTALPGWIRGNFDRIPLDGLARRVIGLARRRGSALSAPGAAFAKVVRTVVAARAWRQPGVAVVEDLAPTTPVAPGMPGVAARGVEA